MYDDVIGKPEGVDYTLVLSSSTDAQITEDGVLQVDYDGWNDTAASAAGNYDGTYTIWGIGGFSCQNGDKLTYRIRTTAGTEIRYSTVPKDGYKWEKVTVDGTNTTEKAFVKAVTDKNVVRVYFVTDAPVLPKTGDTTGLFVWTVLAAAALTVCVGLGVKRKIRRK